MSNSDQMPRRMPEPPSPNQRSGCATAFMLTAGICLLLPGLLCTVLAGGSSNNPFVLLVLGGAALIVWAFVRK